VCPITHELMSDPVVTADGQSYERYAIEQWLKTSTLSPLTNEPLAHLALTPNMALRRLIIEWKETRELASPPKSVSGRQHSHSHGTSSRSGGGGGAGGVGGHRRGRRSAHAHGGGASSADGGGGGSSLNTRGGRGGRSGGSGRGTRTSGSTRGDVRG
jgi:hypothetical protein